jgi:hypothetical protein
VKKKKPPRPYRSFLRTVTAVWACLIVLCLPSCAMFQAKTTPEQRTQMIAELDAARDRGQITPAQHDIAVEAITKDAKSIDWVGLGTVGLNLLLIVLGVPVAIGIKNKVVEIHQNTQPDPTPTTPPSTPA